MGGNVWTVNECHAANAGRDLIEHLQPFSADGRLEILEARDVSARTRQVRNKAASNRIGNDDEHDRDRLRRFLHNRSRRIGPDDNDVWRGLDQLRGAGAHPFRYLVCETVIKLDVSAVIPAKFVKTLPERRKIVFHLGPTVVRKGYQYADAPQAPRLLRARRERPDDRDTAEKRDELAPSHSRP